MYWLKSIDILNIDTFFIDSSYLPKKTALRIKTEANFRYKIRRHNHEISNSYSILKTKVKHLEISKIRTKKNFLWNFKIIPQK